MVSVSKRQNKRMQIKVEQRRWETVWESAREKPMKAPRMLEMKLSFKSRCKDTKERRKTRIKMLTKSKKTILKWKEISMETCTLNKKKGKKAKREMKSKLRNKWDRLTMNNDSKI